MAKTKRKPRIDSDNEPAVLTGLQEAELIEYVNWSEGDAGLRSAMGHAITKKQQGTFGIRVVNDPESGLIANLDRIKRHRVIHRAMRSIGRHERTLRHAYTLAPKPPDVVRFFGHWQSGIVLAGSKKLTKLINACHLVAMHGKAKQPTEWKTIIDHQVASIRAYESACRAYIAALQLARGGVVATEAPMPFSSPPHYCRISTVYPCPCAGQFNGSAS